MKYFLIFTIFLLCVNIVLASDTSNFVFLTDIQTIKPNEISEKITIQSQDVDGNSVNIIQTACLEIKIDSNTGEFSSSNTTWKFADILPMSKGTANRSFYYKDSEIGDHVITVNIALRSAEETRSCASWPREEWIINWSINQNIIVSDVSDNVQSPDASEPEPTYDVGSSIVWPTEPQIFAEAGQDKIAIAGADIKFSGRTLGLEKKPLDNARYIWTFGDGSKKEGQNVLHAYHYPGEYIAVLNVSSGKYSASDRLLVKVSSNQLKIIEVNQDYIKLKNDSKNELDLSSWFLRANQKFFRFPEITLIKASSELIIPSLISGLSVNNQKADILYPNGSVAYSYSLNVDVDVDVEHSVFNIAVTEPKSTTVVDVVVGNSVSDNEENTQQTVSIISVGQNNSWSLKKWLLVILGVGVVSSIGFLLINRQSST